MVARLRAGRGEARAQKPPPRPRARRGALLPRPPHQFRYPSSRFFLINAVNCAPSRCPKERSFIILPRYHEMPRGLRMPGRTRDETVALAANETLKRHERARDRCNLSLSRKKCDFSITPSRAADSPSASKRRLVRAYIDYVEMWTYTGREGSWMAQRRRTRFRTAQLAAMSRKDPPDGSLTLFLTTPCEAPGPPCSDVAWGPHPRRDSC